MSVTTVIAAPAAIEPLSTDAISNAPLGETWQLLTTAAGYKTLGLQAQIDLRLGGTLGTTSAAGTVETNDILAFDPQHMLALKPRDANYWTVIYFTALGSDMTGVRIVRVGLGDDAPVRARLAAADRALLDRLVELHHPRCARCEAPASRN